MKNGMGDNMGCVVCNPEQSLIPNGMSASLGVWDIDIVLEMGSQYWHQSENLGPFF